MFSGIPAGDLAILAVGLVLAGALTGVLAGVFGVGGGAVIVPVLYELFRIIGVPEDVRMPLCVGTSLAIIIPTSISSFRSHRKRGTVDMDILRAWAVPVVIGTILGALLARWAPPAVFKIVFVMVAGVNAARLIGNLNWRLGDDLDQPRPPVLAGLAALVSGFEGLGEPALPPDLAAELRPGLRVALSTHINADGDGCLRQCFHLQHFRQRDGAGAATNGFEFLRQRQFVALRQSARCAGRWQQSLPIYLVQPTGPSVRLHAKPRDT